MVRKDVLLQELVVYRETLKRLLLLLSDPWLKETGLGWPDCGHQELSENGSLERLPIVRTLSRGCKSSLDKLEEHEAASDLNVSEYL